MDISITDYPAGAAVATDLVTTSPTVRGVDALPDPDALAGLLVRHGIDAVPDEEDVRQVHFLRREVRMIIETETEDQAVQGAAVLMRRAALGPVLRRGSDGWQWHVPTRPDAPLADRLAAFIATGLLGVIRALGHERFRACAAPDCRGVFVDASRAGRRRYCMPELCGNRVNVANHRTRRQAVAR